MGNTAAVSSGGCCCENHARTPRLRRSPLPATNSVALAANETETNVARYHNANSSLSVATASASADDENYARVGKMSYEKGSVPANRDRLGQWAFGQSTSVNTGFNQFRGLDFVKNGRLNKGVSYTVEERQKLGILGLLPPAEKSPEQEIARCKANLDRLKEPLDKYIYLANLQEANEKLFYKLLGSNVQEFMPLVYTPVVGLACQKFSLIFQKPPRGLFITIYDKGHVYDVLRNWPEDDVRAIVVTDGERILGLGDLGANGMGIPIGKLSLYTALAGVKPSQCLPITLDVGTNTESILQDPHYLGLRQKRVTGQEYDDFVEEFMQACVKRFGMNVLIQFEDFGNHNAFKLLAKYRECYTVFNDDIQGTASVAVAGLLAALKLTKNRLSDHVVLFQGAGEASLGIASLCVMAMMKEGTSEKDARSKIWMVDSKGLIVKNRPEGGVSGHKAEFAHPHAPVKDLPDIVKTVKPSILIGASAIGGAFTPDILQAMASFNKQPIIFALSNPTDKAECTAEQAYTHTKGTAIFASGSPFEPLTVLGKRFEPGQGNNSYVFPGISLGVICAGVKCISDELFLIAAQSLADLVQDSDLEVGRLYPPLQEIQACSVKIAAAIIRRAYETGVATTFPKPQDVEGFIKCQMYNPEYEELTPPAYSYPKL